MSATNMPYGTGNGAWATGWIGVPRQHVNLVDPVLPRGIKGPFFLFEFGHYDDKAGGLNDLTGTFKTIEKAKAARTNVSAQIAVHQGGRLVVILEYVTAEYNSASQSDETGWRLPK